MTTILKKHAKWMQYLYVLVGTLVMAFGIKCIYDTTGLVTGGFSGIAIIVKSVSKHFIKGGIDLWISNLVLNIPVFVLAYWKLGKKFVGKTIFGTGMLTVWLYLLPNVNLAEGDLLIAALFGGVFSGTGMGLVLRGGATTGGTDMVAALVRRHIRHYSVVQIMQFIDGLVVVFGLFVFGLHPALYAMVAIFVTTKVSDAILDGFKYSKAAYIITDKYEEIAKKIMVDLDRGVTGLEAKGMYTGNDKCVLYCVVSKKEIVALKEIVVDIDPNAFVIVSEVHEVLGEGFQEYSSDITN